MKRSVIRIQNNSPVVLGFAIACFVVLALDSFTGGYTTIRFFSVYRSPASDIFTYPRFVLHVLGHSDYAHFIGNIMMIHHYYFR